MVVVPMQNFAGRQQQQLGAAMSQVGNEAIRLAEQEQEKINRALARQMSAQAEDEDRQALLEAESLLGQNYIEAHGKYTSGFEERTQRYIDQLPNDDARAAFLLRREPHRAQWLNRLTGHRARQLVTMDNVARDADLASQVADAVIYYQPGEEPQDPQDPNRPPTHEERLASIRQVVVQQLASRGIRDEDAIEVATRAKLTEVHEQLVLRMINAGDFAGAKSYLDQYEKEIEPDVFTRAQKSLLSEAESASRRAAAAQQEDVVEGMVLAWSRAGLTPSEMYSAAGQLAVDQKIDGGTLKEIKAAIKRHSDFLNGEKQREDDEFLSRVGDIFNQNPLVRPDSLGRDIREEITRRGLSDEVSKRHLDISVVRLNTALLESPDYKLFMRDVASLNQISKQIEDLTQRQARLAVGFGVQDKDPAEIEAEKRAIEQRLQEWQEIYAAVSNRSYEHASHALVGVNGMLFDEVKARANALMLPAHGVSIGPPRPPEKPALTEDQVRKLIMESIEGLKTKVAPGGGR